MPAAGLTALSAALRTSVIPLGPFRFSRVSSPWTRNLAGNPDSPQTVVFITSIIDVIHVLLCPIRLAYV